MAVDATGPTTSLGIPTFNTAVDAPSGKGVNAMMQTIDTLIVALPTKPSGLASGEFMVYNGTTFVRSTTTRPDPTSLGTGTPDGTKFLKDNGVWTVPPAASGVLVGVQILTGSGTYTPTSGTNRVYVECVGGGGAGGGAPAQASGNAQGGGGGGGAYAASLLTSGFSGISYVAGAGGTGVSNGAGNAGADTTWNSTTIVAKGGSGGANGVLNTIVAGGAGGSAASSTGQIKIDGQEGWHAGSIGGGSVLGSNGGSSHLGWGAERLVAVGTGSAGKLYGGGGGGGFETSASTNRTGGAGAAGVIRVWEFA